MQDKKEMINVKMTQEEYEFYCKMKEQKTGKIIINDKKMLNECLDEIKECFEEESFSKIAPRAHLLKYKKNAEFHIHNRISYIFKGVVKNTFNSELLSYSTEKNWIGTIKISNVLTGGKSLQETEIIQTNVRMTAQTELLVLSIELDDELVDLLRKDHRFKDTLLMDLRSIILANNSWDYLLMHGNKESVLSAYLLWLRYKKPDLVIWKPAPKELSEQLNFSPMDLRRNINKLIEAGAITNCKELKDNAKKKYYELNKNTIAILEERSGLKYEQIKNLSRIFFDTSVE